MKSSISIGIVGCGFVGTAIFSGFKYYASVKVYDKYKAGLDSLEETVAQNVLFVCVPTPAKEDGTCDTSIVIDALTDIQSALGENPKAGKPVIIKSTIPPDLCSDLQASFNNLEILHSPEFLTERIASKDFAAQTHNAVIIGAGKPVSANVRKLFKDCFPSSELLECSWNEAAIVKYGLNCFFATKISFMNEIAQICEGYGASLTRVLNLMKKDDRMSPHHMDVPGHDGKLGFGGACFPKDLQALIRIAEDVGVSPTVLLAALVKNTEVRDG